MTREDANFILANIDRRVCDAELSEALDMAIKALSTESCEDCIDRQAALDGIEELKKSPWATDKRGNGFEYLIKEALEVVADLCVKQLPSVTPKPKMGRLIKVVTEADYLGNETYHYECSECGFKSFFGTERYCQNCGAKMVESDSEEESEDT